MAFWKILEKFFKFLWKFHFHFIILFEMSTKGGFKKIVQRIEYLESKNKYKYNEFDSSLSDNDLFSNSSDDLFELSKEKGNIKLHKNPRSSRQFKSDDFDISDSSDEEFSYHTTKKNKHLSLSSDSSSFSSDEQKSHKIKRRHRINQPFHYNYKKYSKDFSLDSATSDFDNVFLHYYSEYSSDSFHDD